MKHLATPAFKTWLLTIAASAFIMAVPANAALAIVQLVI